MIKKHIIKNFNTEEVKKIIKRAYEYKTILSAFNLTAIELRNAAISALKEMGEHEHM